MLPSFTRWKSELLLSSASRTNWLLLVVAVLLSECSPNLARRYKNMWNKNRSVFTWVHVNDVPKYANVELNSYPVETLSSPVVPSRNLLNLAGEGQAAFINSLNARTPWGTTAADTKAFIELLATNFPSDAPTRTKVKIIPKTLKKTLVFTTERPRFHAREDTTAANNRTPFYNFGRLADRLAYLELSVALPATSKLGFNSWDRFVTKEVNVDLGNVTSAREWNASVTANAGSTNVVGSTTGDMQTQGIGPVGSTSATDGTTSTTSTTNGGSKSSTLGLGVAGTAGIVNKYATALSLSNRILALSGTLTPTRITVVQEGAQGIDLSGNQSLAVEYTTNAEWATPIWVHQLPKKLYEANGSPVTLATLKLSGFYILFPDVPPVLDAAGKDNPAAHFIGALRYRFLYRHVTRGNSHLPEARHKAEYLFGQVGYSYDRSKAKGEDGAKGDNEKDTRDGSWTTEVNGQLIPSTKWAKISREGKPVELANSSDFRPATYRLQYEVTRGSTVTKYPLKFKDEIVDFETLQEASTFLQYLHDVLPLAGAPSGGIVTLDPAAATVVNQVTLTRMRVVKFQY